MAYRCDTCGISFATEHELREHGRIHMAGGPAAPAEYACKLCGGSFPNEAALKSHVASAHPM